MGPEGLEWAVRCRTLGQQGLDRVHLEEADGSYERAGPRGRRVHHARAQMGSTQLKSSVTPHVTKPLGAMGRAAGLVLSTCAARVPLQLDPVRLPYTHTNPQTTGLILHTR